MRFCLPDLLARRALPAAILFAVAAAPVWAATAGSATSLIATDVCFTVCPLLPPPPPFRLGEPHQFVVAARDDGNAIDLGFTGNVVFTSSDPNATLPPPYRFTAADMGFHRFEFVVRTLGVQAITAADAAGVLRSSTLSRNVVGSTAVPTLGGVVTGSDGNLWYASAGDGFSQPGRIGRMTPTGVVTLFDVPPTPPSRPRSAPQDVALGADGNVWFADANSAIGRITPAGTITLFPTPAAGSVPFHIVSGPDGALWFTEFGASRIGRIDMAGAIQEYVLPAGAGAPWGIAAGADGRLWFTTNSSFVGSVGVAGDMQIYANPVGSESLGIGSGPDGAVWFGSLGYLIRAVPGYPAVPIFQPIPLLFGSTAMRVHTGPDGRLWIGQQGSVVRAEVAACGDDEAVCLEGRFRARVELRGGDGGVSGARPLFRTGNTGHFSFFTPNNIDLAVKVVDGRAFNGRYWVFVGSLTDVGFTLTVTDTATGAVKVYRGAAGRQESIADTSAFGAAVLP
jgi:virginiamycin B lyase